MKSKNESIKKTVWIMAGLIASMNFMIFNGNVLIEKLRTMRMIATACVNESVQAGETMLVEPVLNFFNR